MCWRRCRDCACQDEHPVLRSRAKTKRTSFVKSAISCTWARCWKEVRKVGEKLRVTAQLINVSDGYHLWSKDCDGDVKDILNFQSNVAAQVVQALQVKLGGEGTRVLAKKPTENPEAHRLYLLGRYEFAKYTQTGWNNAIRYYEQALRIDPEFALAYCGLV